MFSIENGKNPLNSVQLVGKLMKAPFVNETQSGRKVARVLLVVQRPGRGSAANIQLVDWGDDWGSNQSNPKDREGISLHDLSAGTTVRVQGELNTSSYTPQGSDKRIFQTEVDVRAVEVLDDEAYRQATADATVVALT